jgi:hypothetical protein
MTDKNTHPSARLAGLLYLLLAVVAAFGMQIVPSTIIIPGDVATTIQNIIASESLFRLGIVSSLIGQVIQIFVVFALYHLLKPIHKDLAKLMVVFILVAVPLAMLNELNYFITLILVGSGNHLTGLSPELIQSLVAIFLDLHEYGIMIGHIFWGLWLLPMGYLIFKSGFIPNLLGILLIIGGIGYIIDFLLAALGFDIGFVISQFTFIGELLLPLWLLIRGVNIDKWQKAFFSMQSNSTPKAVHASS